MLLKNGLALLLSAALSCSLSSAAFASDNIEIIDTTIDATHFPDSAFRQYVSSVIDTDHSGALSSSEINAVTAMDVSDKGIVSLSGIEYFSQLEHLYCTDNAITRLDVSQNTVLTSLDCSRNQLTSLDVSALRHLESFKCEGNSYELRGVANQFNLSTLPQGFVLARASSWSGATLEGTLLSPTKTSATYRYDCGGNYSATFTFTFSEQAVTISLDAHGGNVSPNSLTCESGKVDDFPTPVREGYTFLGWFLPDGTRATTSTLFTTDTTLEAHWQATETLPFWDVSQSDWFYNDVSYAYSNGLMNGVDSASFAPYQTTNRAMIATVLWRMNGEVTPSSGDRNFVDVDGASYYYNAVYWALESGITSGFSEYVFAPNEAITREQLACFLYNTARYQDEDTSARADLEGFSDSSDISSWAEDALAWAVSEGLIGGKTSDTLAPKDAATRAEVAAILHRFETKN